tara:strand:+ start:1066 stop:1386 length:321 start_codon:yes stop_codon:yes gene_type:complete
MNQKIMKEIERHTKKLLVEWIQSLVPEEEAEKINTRNVIEFIPKQVHYYANQRVSLSSYSPKWIKKYIKIIKKNKENMNISDITLQDILNEQVVQPVELSDAEEWS